MFNREVMQTISEVVRNKKSNSIFMVFFIALDLSLVTLTYTKLLGKSLL